MCLLEFCQFCVIGWCGWGLWIITFDGIFNFLVWWTIAIEGDIFCFRPFRAIMWVGVLLDFFPGCYPGLTRRIPFQGIYSTYAQFNTTTAIFCSTLYTTNSKFIWGCCVTPIENFFLFPPFLGYNVGLRIIALLPRVLPWAYEADSLSGNLLCFCTALFGCFMNNTAFGVLYWFSFGLIFCCLIVANGG